MTAIEIILGALLILASLVMIIVIILQEGNQQGVGVVSGGADTFFSKNKARSYDAFLARATKWFAIGFVVFVLAINIIAFFSNKNVETAKATADSASYADQLAQEEDASAADAVDDTAEATEAASAEA